MKILVICFGFFVAVCCSKPKHHKCDLADRTSSEEFEILRAIKAESNTNPFEDSALQELLYNAILGFIITCTTVTITSGFCLMVFTLWQMYLEVQMHKHFLAEPRYYSSPV
ncbi:hypothetical protein X975_18163, partial [Stegodyphus mimosarum]